MRFLIILIGVLGGLAAGQTAADQLLKRAIEEQQQGNFSAAIADYKKVLQLRPATVEAKVNMGAALAHVGRYDEAISAYRSALPSLRDKNPVIRNLGLAYYKKGDFENACRQFTILRKAQPRMYAWPFC